MVVSGGGGKDTYLKPGGNTAPRKRTPGVTGAAGRRVAAAKAALPPGSRVYEDLSARLMTGVSLSPERVRMQQQIVKSGKGFAPIGGFGTAYRVGRRTSR
jgi:hypothetical protein